MPVELAYSFVEASYDTMKKFIDSGIIERLKIIHKCNQEHPEQPIGFYPPSGQSPEEKIPSDH